jgi:glycosyltransferase involved in cell wall biosynthesis
VNYAIVLSTFQGEHYVDAQLESIRAQTAPDWRLYVRDDGSSDGTQGRLLHWAKRDDRIELLPNDGRNIGAAASFGVLLQYALDRGARHIFLSDQDDVWLPEKCERLLVHMERQERAMGQQIPALIHSDLRVVRSDLREIHPSFNALQHMEAAGPRAATRLLLRNSVTGCATLVNAALVRCALPMPTVAMHDWWLAQCAAAFGHIHFVPEALVLYRQHGNNLVGARGMLMRGWHSFRFPGDWWNESARRFLAGLRQLWILRCRAGIRGIPMNREIGDALEMLWAGLSSGGGGARARIEASIRSGALPGNALMRTLLLIRIAVIPRLRSWAGDESLAVSEGEKG